VNQQFVLLGLGLDDDLTIRMDNQAAADQGWPSSTPALATHTTRSFCKAGLRGEPVVEQRFSALLALLALTEGVLYPISTISTHCRPSAIGLRQRDRCRRPLPKMPRGNAKH